MVKVLGPVPVSWWFGVIKGSRVVLLDLLRQTGQMGSSHFPPTFLPPLPSVMFSFLLLIFVHPSLVRFMDHEAVVLVRVHRPALDLVIILHVLSSCHLKIHRWKQSKYRLNKTNCTFYSKRMVFKFLLSSDSELWTEWKIIFCLLCIFTSSSNQSHRINSVCVCVCVCDNAVCHAL